MTETVDGATALGADPPARSAASATWRRIHLQEAALPVVVVLLMVAGTIADREAFLTQDNLLTVLTQVSVTGVVALGMTFVIATGGIDLSVGSMLAAASIAGGLVGEQQSAPFMLGAIGFGLLLGLVNGVAIAYGRIVPFIATLAMFAGARGLALWMSDKTPISLLDLDVVREMTAIEKFAADHRAHPFVIEDGVEAAAPEREPMVTVTKDGPYAVTGGIELVEVKFGEGASPEHYTLCRCGASKNKPFCDGSHKSCAFMAAERATVAPAGDLPLA